MDLLGSELKEEKKNASGIFHLEKSLHFQVKCSKHVQVYQHYWVHRK